MLKNAKLSTLRALTTHCCTSHHGARCFRRDATFGLKGGQRKGIPTFGFFAYSVTESSKKEKILLVEEFGAE